MYFEIKILREFGNFSYTKVALYQLTDENCTFLLTDSSLQIRSLEKLLQRLLVTVPWLHASFLLPHTPTVDVTQWSSRLVCHAGLLGCVNICKLVLFKSGFMWVVFQSHYIYCCSYEICLLST